MIKTLALIVRRADHSRDAFRQHYEEIHAPLALPLMPGLLRYCRNHVVRAIHGEPAFDVLSAFEYPSLEAAGETFARIQSAEGDAIRADELTFMDPPKNVFFLAQPEVQVEGAEGEEHVFVLVRAPEGSDEGAREDWLAAYDAEAHPALLASLSDVGFAALNRIASAGPDAPPWDRVTQLRAAGTEGLEAWARAQEARGGAVLAVRTRCYDTAL